MFKVKPGIYHIPNYGKLDTRNKVSDSQLLALYENKAFPFIEVTEKAVSFLKKQKLSEQRVLALLDRATSKEEIDILLQVKSTTKTKSLADKKRKNFTVSS